ncbi:MAG: InlB B-repeat-containing protein, partial [Bifidobacterium sp.]|nr:InlB B-repeat-containing protein [Bifidobacterium sp.]
VRLYAGWEQSLALGSDGNLYTWGWNCGGQLGDPTIPTGYDNSKAMRLTPGLAAFPLTPDLTAVKFDQTLGSNLKKAGTNWQVVTPAHRKGRVDTAITWNLYGPQPDDILDYTYDPPSYTVTFDKADGSQPTSQSVVEDQTASRPDQDPTRPGFLFDGWFSGDAAYDFASPVKGSLKLTAHWTAGTGRWTTSPKQGPDSGQTKVTLVPPAARGIRFSQVSAGDDHSLALGSDGNIYAWGANKYGQLGDGTTTDRLTPVQIPKPTGVNRFIQVSAGKAFSVALDGQGHVWAWGLNSSGQLGSNAVATNGSAAYSSNPIRVQAPSGMTATNFTLTGVSAGITHVLAVDGQGRAWGWGSNEFGKLGVPSNTVATTGITTRPVQVTTPQGETTGFRYAQVSAGGSHSLATDTQGRAWGWGSNQNGDLGNTSDVALNGYTSTPVQAKPGTNPTGGFRPVQIIAGSGHSSALDDLGRLWSWGGNSNGELGLGDTTTRTAPSLVAMPANVSTFTQLTGSRASGNSLALDQNGNIWGWGQNSSGMLGTGGTGSLNKPTRMGNPSGIDHFVRISAGTGHTLAIASTGGTLGWGDNGQGRLGNNTTQTVYSPVNVLFPFRLGTPSTVQFGGVSGTSLNPTGQQDGAWTVLTPNHNAGDTTVSIAWTLNGAPQPNDETNAFRFIHYGVLPLTGEAGILVIIMVGSLAAVSGLAAKRQRLEAQSGPGGKTAARHKH